MARTLSKQRPIQINSDPLSQQKGEPQSAYEMFLSWVEADGRRSFAEIALKYAKKADTPRRYSTQWRWHDRLQLIQAARGENPAQVVPVSDAQDDLEDAVNGAPIDPVVLRIENALDVAERAYREASALHKQLFAVASEAATNLTAQDIKSISELRSIVQLTTELAKTRTELSSNINGIEELAKAVSKLRRRRSNG